MKTQSHHPRLLRGLSVISATSLVVGTIIGTGIFLKAAIMSQLLGSAPLVLLAWITAGLLSLAGALTYAELGCLFPRAGGEYVYLREAYGQLPAFLFGWMRFWIGGPGSIAAFAVGAATFFSGAMKFAYPEVRLYLAIGFIIFFTLLNCLSVAIGGRILTLITSVKLFLILGIPIGIIIFSDSTSINNLTSSSEISFTWGAFGSAMLAALWAFDGWNNLPMMAGEVHQPEVNVPKALIFGTLLVLIVYGLVNFSYFYALPINEIITSSSKSFPNAQTVAAKAAQTFLGEQELFLFSALLVISAIGAMNGSVMSGSRVPFALAQDGLFPKWIAKISKSNHVPYVSLLAQGAIAIILALSGSFDQLTDYVVFANWIFYALVGYSVFIFRKHRPHEKRVYRVLGYPFLPIIFIGMAILLLINTLLQSPQESLLGLFLIALGYPVYWLFHKK